MHSTTDKRPVNLNIFTIQFPLPALISILHRISGIVLFLALPFLLWALHQSLVSAQTFDAVCNLFKEPFMRFVVWAICVSAFYHVAAGIRHLAMDIGFGDALPAGKYTAAAVLIVSIVAALILGAWLWA